jgi:predicted O-methyltransferase YrrM
VSNGPTVRGLLGKVLVRTAQRLSEDTAFVALPSEVFNERPGPPLWGWGRPRHSEFEEMFEAGTSDYLSTLEMIKRYGDGLAAIDRGHRDDLEPCWTNPMFSGLDGASLYWYLRERQPRRYIEIGSGYSTKFAARAKRDGDGGTEIVSIDPHPRADIDEICDRLIRAPLELADRTAFQSLEPHDVVLLDGSHRLLMGNHLVVFFLEILPRLPSGLLVGVHDIYLPDDYAPDHVENHWNEQYLVATTLLAGQERYRTVLPCHYVASTSPVKERLVERWSEIGLDGINAWGSLLWFRIA